MTADTHEMNEQQFLFLQQLLTDRTGIHFRDQAHLCRKLGSRLRALNLDSYARYIEIIKKKSDEILHAIEAVTTNETFLLRDFIHLIALKKYLDTYLNATRVFSIWSAASSSGEEVYRIAMTVHARAAARRIAAHNIRITGSDIDRSALKRTIDGRYHRCQVQRTPKNYKTFLLRYLEQHSGDYFNVKPHIKAMMRPMPVNRPLGFTYVGNSMYTKTG